MALPSRRTLLLTCALVSVSDAFTPSSLRGRGASLPSSLHAPPLIASGGRPSVTLLRGGQDDAAPSGLARVYQNVVGFIDRRYFIVGAAAAVAMAAAAPSIGRTGGLLRPELTVGWGATCGIFLISGLTLPTSELAAAAFRVREHAAIQGFNLAVLPLATLALTTMLGGWLPAALRDGLLALAALPTTVNMCVALTRTAGGNEALAIFNAVIGNILGVLVTPPLLLWLLGASSKLSVLDATIKLTKKVILPLIAGQCLRPLLAQGLKGRKKLLSRTSETLLLAIVYTTFCDTFLRGFGLPSTTVALLGACLAAGHAGCLAITWQLGSPPVLEREHRAPHLPSGSRVRRARSLAAQPARSACRHETASPSACARRTRRSRSGCRSSRSSSREEPTWRCCARRCCCNTHCSS